MSSADAITLRVVEGSLKLCSAVRRCGRAAIAAWEKETRDTTEIWEETV